MMLHSKQETCAKYYRTTSNVSAAFLAQVVPLGQTSCRLVRIINPGAIVEETKWRDTDGPSRTKQLGGCGFTCATTGRQPAPAVWFAYSSDRRGAHPQQHLREFSGTVQADAFAGFDALYADGRMQEAGFWAHVRRKFFDLVRAHDSPFAKEALVRIGALYAVDAAVRSAPPPVRREAREIRSRPLLDDLHDWLNAQSRRVPRKSGLGAAIQYVLNDWRALVRYAGDGRIEIASNAAERALRGVALGRKNYLFAGSDAGGERGHDLQPDRLGQNERAGPGGLSARRTWAHCRPPDQSHRGIVAMEHRSRPARRAPASSVNPTRSATRWPPSNTSPRGSRPRARSPSVRCAPSAVSPSPRHGTRATSPTKSTRHAD